MHGAQAALAETQTRLSQATIRAPVSGLIISRSVTKGQIISAGTELFRMVRDGRLELDAQVPETELPLIQAGQSAAVTSSQAGSTTGTVRIVTPEVDPQTRLGLARISLAPGSALKPGMFLRADITLDRIEDALVVPDAALTRRGDADGVFLVDDAGTRAAWRAVRVGVQAGSWVQLLEADLTGRVGTLGQHLLDDGSPVAIAEPLKPAP